MGAVFVPLLVVAAVMVVYFALALIEHIWSLDPAEMRRRYERGAKQRMPRLKKKAPNA
jgi:hypothetical protein